MPTLISTESLHSEFKHVLSDHSNTKIILSGIFGIGKTTFIRSFFEKETKDFICIKLFPVNYSVATNEDIFELIKYDIFYELLDLQPKFENLKANWKEALYFLSLDDIKEVLADFVALIPKLGKNIKPIEFPVVEIARLLEKAIKTIPAKQKRLRKNDLADIMEYAKLIETNTGGIYENDFYTQLIETQIDGLKVNLEGSTRRVVLVIDDLDRIDPEHIFRIMNVFAAHFDRHADKNKFNIDKIVLCCDIENVRKIFHTKYGASVDFNGYIDKFFSKGIFYFKNKNNIKDAIPKIISSITSTEISYLFIGRDHYIHKFLVRTLSLLFDANVLNLRMLMKYANSDYNPIKRNVLTDTGEFPVTSIPILQFFEFVGDLYGGHDNLVLALEKIDITKAFNANSEGKMVVGDIFYIFNWNGVVFLKMEENIRGFKYGGQEYRFQLYQTQWGDKYLYSGFYQAPPEQLILPPDNMMNELFIRATRNYFTFLRV